MNEIDTLVQEQEADNLSNFVIHDNLKGSGRTVISVETAKLVALADDYNAKQEHHCRISWGQPAKITQIKIDKQCGCGAIRGDAIVDGDYIIPNGLDLYIRDRAVIYCLCWHCGFAF